MRDLTPHWPCHLTHAIWNYSTVCTYNTVCKPTSGANQNAMVILPPKCGPQLLYWWLCSSQLCFNTLSATLCLLQPLNESTLVSIIEIKRIPPWGSSLTARMNNPGWKFGVGSLIEKNSLHFQSKPLIDAICSPMLNRVLERLPGMPIKIVLNLKLRIHSSLNGLRRLRPLLIMWFKLH